MTQIVVTLTQEADANFIRRVIENLRGVVDAKLSQTNTVNTDKEGEEWFSKLENIRKNYDSSYIDMNDDRTGYIMSK